MNVPFDNRETAAQPATVSVCSNPKCYAVWSEDPNGPCPACRKPHGAGWSTIKRVVRPLPTDGVRRDPLERCANCGERHLDHNLTGSEFVCSNGKSVFRPATQEAGHAE